CTGVSARWFGERVRKRGGRRRRFETEIWCRGVTAKRALTIGYAVVVGVIGRFPNDGRQRRVEALPGGGKDGAARTGSAGRRSGNAKTERPDHERVRRAGHKRARRRRWQRIAGAQRDLPGVRIVDDQRGL